MNNIPRHRVFISYYHADDQYYKDMLLEANDRLSLFEDLSVHEDDIDDTGLSSEQIRQIIRDKYIKDATVLVLLCGQNTRKRKHIDWEIHAAMYHSDVNPQMGILVINLPGAGTQERSTGIEEKKYFDPQSQWVSASKDRATIEKEYPYMPARIIDNLAKEDVCISVVNWDTIEPNADRLKGLIDIAFQRKNSNKYDHSAPLRRQNS